MTKKEMYNDIETKLLKVSYKDGYLIYFKSKSILYFLPLIFFLTKRQMKKIWFKYALNNNY
jgi:hypothetical protein